MINTTKEVYKSYIFSMTSHHYFRQGARDRGNIDVNTLNNETVLENHLHIITIFRGRSAEVNEYCHKWSLEIQYCHKWSLNHIH